MIKITPNLLSISRILLVPFILFLIINKSFFIAFCLCCIASLTDLLDGFLARKFNAVTDLGFYLDSMADKFFILSLYLIIGFKMLLPLYIIVIIIFRDILISGSYFFFKFKKKELNLKPTLISKINTFMQMFLIIIILLNLSDISFLSYNNDEIISLFSYFVIFTTLSSFFIYINIWFKE